jgi:carboxymethylenebutenolidase
MYCGFADDDPYVPPGIAVTLDSLLGNRLNLQYRSVTHAGARHGYAIPDRDVYDREAAEKDWTEIFAMFARALR